VAQRRHLKVETSTVGKHVNFLNFLKQKDKFYVTKVNILLLVRVYDIKALQLELWMTQAV